MAFNRWVDADIDGANPRTAIRSIPAGRLTRAYALGFTIITSALFIGAAWMLNPLAFKLSPLLLAVLLGYSLTKRFTALCNHFIGDIDRKLLLLIYITNKVQRVGCCIIINTTSRRAISKAVINIKAARYLFTQ